MRNHKYEKVALKNLKNNQFKAKNVNIGRSGFNNNSVLSLWKLVLWYTNNYSKIIITST